MAPPELAVRVTSPMRLRLLFLVVSLSACPRLCNRSTCDGCCASETECVEGAARLECGIGGEVCTRCTSQERCVAARCEAIPVVDAGVTDAGPTECSCITSCCNPDGTCAPNNGIDACGPSKAFCGVCRADQRCERGTCVAAGCTGCLDPLGTCRSGANDTTCGIDGGVCTACGTDQACQAGRCVFTRCDMNNCRFGCCQPDKVCMNSSAMACGLGGEPCAMCTGAQRCLGGTCQ